MIFRNNTRPYTKPKFRSHKEFDSKVGGNGCQSVNKTIYAAVMFHVKAQSHLNFHKKSKQLTQSGQRGQFQI